MKQAFRNVLAVAGLLLMIASLVWISFHQEKRPAVYRESKATQPRTSKPFAVVVLDPGHGGQDSGAMCGGVMEKDLTLDVARRVDRLLDSEGDRHIDDPARGQLCLTGGSRSVRESGERQHFYQHSFQRRQ